MADQPRKTIRVVSKAPPPQPLGQEPELKPISVPGVGQLPFRPGVFILPEEKAKLAKLGWREGDPIPPNMARALQAEADAVRKNIEDALPVSPDTPPVRLPKEVPIESLPPERQEALRKFMASYKEMQANPDDADPGALPAFVPMASDPSINQAMAAMAAPGRVAVTNSGGRDSGTVIGGTPPPEEPKPFAAGPTGASLSPAVCKQCGWKQADPIDLVPTATDKMVFLQAVAGGLRFKKAFDLFGKSVQITFRSPAINEIELCLSQVAYDQRDGKVTNHDQATMFLMDYRLALSIDSFKVGDQFQELPETLDDWHVEEVGAGQGPVQTKLPRIVEWLQTQTPLGRDFVWRAVGQASNKFHKLYQYMEARAPDADFWSAIGDAT